MIDPEDLERRVRALETTVETERLARASMDIDVAELELAVRRTTNAVERLRAEVTGDLAGITGRLARIELDLSHMRQDLGTLTSTVIEVKSVQAEGFRQILEELSRINRREGN